MKRFLSSLLCAVLVLGILPAVSPPAWMQATSGTITPNKAVAYVGDYVTWNVAVEGGSGNFYVYYNVRIAGSLIVDDVYGDNEWSSSYLASTVGLYRAECYVYDKADNMPVSLVSSWTNVTLRPATTITSVKPLSGTSLKITWNPIPGASGYLVYRGASEAGPFNFIEMPTALSYTDTGLTPGTRYYYKVQTYNLFGVNFAPSGEFSATASGIPMNPAPAISKVEALSGTSLKLTWNKIAGATGYEVWRSTSKTGIYKLVKTTSALSFTNTYLKAGTRYFYKIRAYNLIGTEKVPSSNFSAIKAGVPLAKSAIISATGVSTSQIKLTWKKVTGATGYQVFRSTTAGGTYKLIKSTTALTYTAGGMLHAKTYYFKVRPYKRLYTTNYYGPLSGYKAGKTK